MSDTITLPREVVKEALEALEHYATDETPEGWHAVAAIPALRTALAAEQPKQEPVAWAYCPECGSLDVRHEEGSHKQCATCFQEWFSDIDYSDVVQQNLNRLYTALPDIEALRLNDARYRYLRNRDPKEVFGKSGKAAGVWIDWEDDMAGLQLLTGDDADAAIDAAMGDKT